MVNQKAQEMGVPVSFYVHADLYHNNGDYKKLYDSQLDFDVAVRDQYEKEEAEKKAAEERRQAQIRANNGFGGRRRRSKKSKRRQRKTRRR
jgi:hypothetical protein